jgi:hypothetical protein
LYSPCVTESMESLERRLGELRAEVRRAAASRDAARVRALRAELRNAERDWDDALARLEDRQLAPGDAATSRAPLRTQPDGSGVAVVAGGAATAPGGGPLPPARGWPRLPQMGRCCRCGSRFTRR